MTLSGSLPLVLKKDATEIVINDWTVLHFTTPFITIKVEIRQYKRHNKKDHR
jgi:hypothetical protein